MATITCQRPHVARPGSRANSSYLKVCEDPQDYAGAVKSATDSVIQDGRKTSSAEGWVVPKG